MCFGDEILVDKLLELRRDLNHHHHHHHAKSSQSTGKISTLAIFIKAFDVALSDFPMVNSIVHNVEQCEYKIRKSHNIGIAMDTPRGLVVPVIRNCQTLSIVEIQNELDRYKELAESGKFAESDLTDVTFTISNIGSIGGTYMQPVLAPPALAMAALGRIKVVPRFVNNDDDAYDSQEVYPASVLSATLAADHRFLDGATLARFARAFQRYVESPVFMLSRLK
jgi:2-oxoisovalerate dehydrogenase E2 component (dihydrolipoyl transacylase)